MNTSRKIGLCALLPGVLSMSGLLAAGDTSAGITAENTSKRNRKAVVQQLDPNAQLSVAEKEALLAQKKKERTLRYAKQNQVDALHSYLTQGGDIGLMDAENKTLLHWAVEIWSPDCVQLLLTYHADVNALDMNEKTPFMAFLEGSDHKRDTIIFYFFMKRKPDIDFECIGESARLLVRFSTLLDAIFEHGQSLLLNRETNGWFLKQCVAFNRLVGRVYLKVCEKIPEKNRAFLEGLCKKAEDRIEQLKHAPLLSKL